jgi:hypothetical protein
MWRPAWRELNANEISEEVPLAEFRIRCKEGVQSFKLLVFGFPDRRLPLTLVGEYLTKHGIVVTGFNL